jgi:3-hydroxyisobutyrate dehydrogenase
VHTNFPVAGPVPDSPANHDFTPGFATRLMNKDLGLAVEAIHATRSSAPMGTHAAAIFADSVATHAEKDFSAVIELLRAGAYV